MTNTADEQAAAAAGRLGAVAEQNPRHAAFASLGLKSRLRWFLAEFLVVVSGVLVALALSSWAQDRSDDKREHAYLRQLSADLRASESILAEASQMMDLRAAASARVLHRFWTTNPRLDDEFRDDLALPRSTRRVRPVLGTTEALVATGDIKLIRSDALRVQLLVYLESMKASLEDIGRYDETYYRPAVQGLVAGPDLLQFLAPHTEDDRLRSRPNVVERVPFPATLREFLDNRAVYDGYLKLLVAHRNQSARYAEMLEETRALRERVDAAVAP